MQFINHGPDIPASLLSALDEDRLVIVCGAGLSRRAGLPLFSELATDVLNNLNEIPNQSEKRALDNKSYDRLFGLLENRLIEGVVRDEVVKILSIPPKKRIYKKSHKAVLTLSTNSRGHVRLVTTNFDYLFEITNPKLPHPYNINALPIAGKKGWDGVVHLHGRIDYKTGISDHLILTNYDFGDAYLYGRWAARFVVDLFRNFNILFIGYSAEDPVMRYLLDAIASNRKSGDPLHEAYAFVSYSKEKYKEQVQSWTEKSIIPIPYQEDKFHSHLHDTLHSWSVAKKKGLAWKKSIINKYSSHDPSELSEAEKSQVIWVVSDITGFGIETFAKRNPVPPLSWLDVFEDIPGLLKEVFDKKSIKSGVRIYGNQYQVNSVDELTIIESQICVWLTRHLNKHELLSKLLKRGGYLHPHFKGFITRELEIPQYSKRIPKKLRNAWNILISNSPAFNENVLSNTFYLLSRFRNETWNPQLHTELVESLSLCLQLEKPLDYLDDSFGSLYQEQKLPGGKVIFRHNEASMLIEALNSLQNDDKRIIELADDITSIIKNGMDLLASIDKADSNNDWSYIYIASISENPQNAIFEEWCMLVPLLRKSLTALIISDKNRAKKLVERWRTIKYPIFKRLYLYAMREKDLYTNSEVIKGLSSKIKPSIWDVQFSKELNELLVERWAGFDLIEKNKLSIILLSGPPRSLYKASLSKSEFESLRDSIIFKIASRILRDAGSLTKSLQSFISDAKSNHPNWKLAAGDRDDFGSYTSSSVGETSDFTVRDLKILTPDKLIKILRYTKKNRRGLLATWKAYVSEVPDIGIKILEECHRKKLYKTDIWSQTIYGFADSNADLSTHRKISIIISKIKDNLLRRILWEFSRWLQTWKNKTNKRVNSTFWSLWTRAITLAIKQSRKELNRIMTDAINHPSGILTEILIRDFLADRLVGSGVPKSYRNRFDTIINTNGPNKILCQVILASHLYWLTLVDHGWTEKNIIPWFKWSNYKRSVGVWTAYIGYGKNIDYKLYKLLSDSFIKTLDHIDDIDEQIANNYVNYITIVCINSLSPDSDGNNWGLTKIEIKRSLNILGKKYLPTVARHLWNTMRITPQRKKSRVWREKVGPLLSVGWPLGKDLQNPNSSEFLANAVIESGAAFSHAVSEIRIYLLESSNLYMVLHHLAESNQPENYPEASLELLFAFGPSESNRASTQLRQVLNRISTAWEDAKNDQRYKIYDEFLQRYGL